MNLSVWSVGIVRRIIIRGVNETALYLDMTPNERADQLVGAGTSAISSAFVDHEQMIWEEAAHLLEQHMAFNITEDDRTLWHYNEDLKRLVATFRRRGVGG